MQELVDYIRNHTDRNACRCGKCVVNGIDKPLEGHTANMFFFDVSTRNDPDAETFKGLIRKYHKGVFCDVDPFDGNEHGYIELGGWLGDQGLALLFMGLGKLLKLWEVLEPMSMLGLDRNDPLAKQIAGAGMVCIQAGQEQR